VQSLNKFQEEVGGPLRGGDPGIRLVEPADGACGACAPEVPPAFAPRLPKFLLVPLQHVFGSEELSSLSPPVGERIPKPYVALNAEDAAALHVAEGDAVEVELAGAVYKAPVTFRTGLPSGVAGLPVGLPGMPVKNLPAWGKVVRGAVT
jgi:NADH-quinone oxidoreductase subunit G